jgi:hypothetical protein
MSPPDACCKVQVSVTSQRLLFTDLVPVAMCMASSFTLGTGLLRRERREHREYAPKGKTQRGTYLFLASTGDNPFHA